MGCSSDQTDEVLLRVWRSRGFGVFAQANGTGRHKNAPVSGCSWGSWTHLGFPFAPRVKGGAVSVDSENAGELGPLRGSACTFADLILGSPAGQLCPALSH